MEEQRYPFYVVPLPYAYSAFEPWIDTMTMQIHYEKHYQGYVDKLNKLLAPYPHLHNKTLRELVSGPVDANPEDRRQIHNQAGGAYNHGLYFLSLSASGVQSITGPFKEAVDRSFGSIQKMKQAIKQKGVDQFASGWAWLCWDKGERRFVAVNTPNQDVPLQNGLSPCLPVDVWEHAYYLRYQYRRPEYLDAFFQVVDWRAVERRWQREM